MRQSQAIAVAAIQRYDSPVPLALAVAAAVRRQRPVKDGEDPPMTGRRAVTVHTGVGRHESITIQE